MEKKLISQVNEYIKKNNLENDHRISKRTPIIAATPAEMQRLKKAWNSSGTEHDLLAERFLRVDRSFSEGLIFPPEGGQHNQWYQCDSCQIGLSTIDAHHHQCPKCKKIYSGFPYDNVLLKTWHLRNIDLAKEAAWAWAVAGKKKYANLTAAILTGYAERYLEYPMVCSAVGNKTVDVASEKRGKYKTAGHILPETLSEASSLVSLSIAYDLVYTYLTEQQRKQIESKLIKPMAENIEICKAGKSNWQTWHNAGMFYAGAVLGDAHLLRLSLLDKENGFLAQMRISVLPDGMWYENSWGYHYYTLSGMTHIAEGGRKMGFDIYDFPPLRKMYFLGFDYQMSDGSLPRFGDAVQDTPNRNVNAQARAAYKDDRLITEKPGEMSWDGILLGLSGKNKIKTLTYESKLKSGAGHAILSSDGPGKLTAALTFGPYGGSHGHFDKLSFVFFGYGEELGVDPGRAESQAYRLPIHKEWYKASTGHNTVLVDGNSQQPAAGTCLAFKTTKSYTAVVADAGTAHQKASHKRFMLLSPNYLLIIDDLYSLDGNEHSYDWLYHNKGLSLTCDLPQNDNNPGKLTAGYSYLDDVSGYNSKKSEPIKAIFSGEKASVALTMAAQDGDEIYTATGPFRSVENRVPMMIVRRKGQTVRFVTLLEPFLTNDNPVKNNLKLIANENYSSITVSYEKEEDKISFLKGKLENFTVEQKRGNSFTTLLKN